MSPLRELSRWPTRQTVRRASEAGSATATTFWLSRREERGGERREPEASLQGRPGRGAERQDRPSELQAPRKEPAQDGRAEEGPERPCKRGA